MKCRSIYGEIVSIWPDNYNDGYIAQDRAREYIQGAFDRSSHSVDLNTPPERPNPGGEHKDSEYTVPCPCNPWNECHYTSVVGYYREWLGCNSYESKDVNIVISSTTQKNGGETCGCGTHAHAQTGQKLCDIESPYQTHGYNDAVDAMHTVLHEIGHLLLKSPLQDGDNDGEKSHDMGYVYRHVDGKTISPMYVNGDKNNCGYSVDQIVGGEEMQWSGCCEDAWRAPY